MRFKLLLLAILLVSCVSIFAQTYTVQIGTGTASPATTSYAPMYRFSATSATQLCVANCLYTATELATAGLPNGALITGIEYNKVNTNSSSTGFLYQLFIANSTATPPLSTATAWTSILSSHTQVYNNSAQTLNSNTGWLPFPFIAPFTYTGNGLEIANYVNYGTSTSNVINGNLQFEVTGGLAANVIGVVASSQTIPAAMSGSVAGYLDRPNVKISYTLPNACSGAPTAGTTVATDTVVCQNTPTTLSLVGSTVASGLHFQWQHSSNGTTWLNSLNDTLTSFSPIVASNTYYRCRVTCANDSAFSTSRLIQTNGALAGGTYTIGGAGANYPNLTAAIAAINCGISGPIVFNITPNSGPYNEQLVIPSINGSSATNTITINGNGNTVSFATNSAQRYVFLLNGAEYLTLKNMTIQPTDAASGVGVLMTNSCNYIAIDSCTIDVSSTLASTATTSAGIAASGSLTSYTTLGSNVNNCTISNCTVIGGYYGIILVGNTGGLNAENHTIVNNTVQDFYYYGMYLSNPSNALVSNNDISRPTRTTVSVFAGIFIVTGGNNNLIEKNKLHDSHTGNTASTSAAYPLYISAVDANSATPNKFINNIVYKINNSGIIYGHYNSSSDNVLFYHNTIALNDSSSTSSSVSRCVYQTTAASGLEYKNNIFSVKRLGAGVQTCLYFNTATTVATFNNNVYDVVAGQNLGYYSATAYTSLAAWQTATSDDANSVEAIPAFANYSTGDFTPTNMTINNVGQNLGVLTDINGTTRTSTPDAGAIEFGLNGDDLQLNAIYSNYAPCYSAIDTLYLSLVNTGVSTLNFANNPFTVSYSISGPNSAASSFTVNSGTLTPSSTLNIPLVQNINLFSNGVYTVAAYLQSTWDIFALNDSLQLVIDNTPPTISVSNDTVCFGSIVNLDFAGFAGDVQWQKNTGTGYQNIGSPTNTTLNDTIYDDAVFRFNYCGSKFSDTLAVVIDIVSPPIAFGDSICLGDSTIVTAFASNDILWYDSEFGGQLIGTGSSFTSNNITGDTAFYAAQVSAGGGTATVGAIDPTIGSAASFTALIQYMNFDVIAPSATITSVDLWPTGTIGSAYTIVVEDASNQVIASFSGVTSAQNAAQTVNVNFVLPAGTGYRMGFSVNPGMTRNSTGANYPYTVPGVISITGNTFGATYYYFFYNIQVQVGCQSARVPAFVHVNSGPTIGLNSTSTFCENSSTILDPNLNSAFGYAWSTGQNQAAINVNSPGTYSVTVTDFDGCSNSASTVLQQLLAPTINLGADTTICPNDPLVLDAGSGLLNVSWSSGQQTQSISVASAGIYSAFVTGTNTCTSSDTIAVGIHTVPTVSLTNSAICTGTSALLDPAPGGSYTFLWSTNETTPSIAVTAGGVYSVTITTADNCVLTGSATITENTANPIVLGNDTTICGNQSITYNVPTGYTGVQWSTGATTSSINANATTLGVGNYTFSVNANDLNGCETSGSINVAVEICQSVDELAPADIVRLYPNPSNGIVTYELTQALVNNTYLKVLTADGRLVYSVLLNMNQTALVGTIDFTQLSKGVYFVSIESNETKLSTQRVVIY